MRIHIPLLDPREETVGHLCLPCLHNKDTIIVDTDHQFNQYLMDHLLKEAVAFDTRQHRHYHLKFKGNRPYEKPHTVQSVQ
jgi:hypothetical protein